MNLASTGRANLVVADSVRGAGPADRPRAGPVAHGGGGRTCVTGGGGATRVAGRAAAGGRFCRFVAEHADGGLAGGGAAGGGAGGTWGTGGGDGVHLRRRRASAVGPGDLRRPRPARGGDAARGAAAVRRCDSPDRRAARGRGDAAAALPDRPGPRRPRRRHGPAAGGRRGRGRGRDGPTPSNAGPPIQTAAAVLEVIGRRRMAGERPPRPAARPRPNCAADWRSEEAVPPGFEPATPADLADPARLADADAVAVAGRRGRPRPCRIRRRRGRPSSSCTARTLPTDDLAELSPLSYVPPEPRSRVALLADASGSMSGRLGEAVAALRSAASALPGETVVDAGTFAGTATWHATGPARGRGGGAANRRAGDGRDGHPGRRRVGGVARSGRAGGGAAADRRGCAR